MSIEFNPLHAHPLICHYLTLTGQLELKHTKVLTTNIHVDRNLFLYMETGLIRVLEAHKKPEQEDKGICVESYLKMWLELAKENGYKENKKDIYAAVITIVSQFGVRLTHEKGAGVTKLSNWSFDFSKPDHYSNAPILIINFTE